ncbi:MAG: hypothetical protein KTR14_03655 [Vampirovibrio sp.]|nr:hypothetical protein [Vampirovibrio sp.]
MMKPVYWIGPTLLLGLVFTTCILTGCTKDQEISDLSGQDEMLPRSSQQFPDSLQAPNNPQPNIEEETPLSQEEVTLQMESALEQVNQKIDAVSQLSHQVAAQSKEEVQRVGQELVEARQKLILQLQTVQLQTGPAIQKVTTSWADTRQSIGNLLANADALIQQYTGSSSRQPTP